VGQYVRLEKRGNRYWGLSPFTTEKTPSFTVTPEKGLYYCFSTNKGGSIFTFLMEMENISFPEAVEQLAARVGVEIPDVSSDDPQAAKRKAIQELYNRVTRSFRHLFTESTSGQAAREYMRSRGLGEEVLEKFSVGYAPADGGWLYRFLRDRQYSPEILLESGLFSRNYPERTLFVERIMFPIKNRRGDVVGFGGRQLSNRGPKYINSPESVLFRKGQELFGLYDALKSIRDSATFYVVEGYVDVLACVQAGETRAIAPLGTSFTEDQARLLGRYARTGVLVFDADPAGTKATRRTAEILERTGLECEVSALTEGTDPADILAEEGSQNLKKSLSLRRTVYDHLLAIVLSNVNSEAPEGKEFVLRELFPYIGSVQSAVRRESYLQTLADRLGVDRQAVAEDFRKRGSEPSRTAPSAPQQKPEIKNTIDLFLMLATVVNREHFPFVRTMLAPNDLQDPHAREMYIALEECYRRSETSVELLLNRIDDENVRSLILEKLASEEFSLNQEQAIKDAVYRIKERSLSARQKRIEARLRRIQAEGSESARDVEELLQEKMYLDGELRKLKVMVDDRTAE